MVAAETLKAGDSLMTAEGKADAITSIETVDYFGKVYNIDMGNEVIEDNIIVAQGFLSGTVYFQNEGLENLNRLILRNSDLLSDTMLK